MRPFLQLLVLSVAALLQVEVYAQRTTLYHENFSGAVVNDAAKTIADNLTYSTSGPALSIATFANAAPAYPQASGGNHLLFSGLNSASLEFVVSTGGYKEIELHWGGQKSSSPNTPTMKLEFSYNNGKFVEVTGWADVGSSISAANGGGIKLPNCLNKGTVKIRWTFTGKTSESRYRFDDIKITGVPFGGGTHFSTPTSTFSWSSRPLGENPYEASVDPNRASGYNVDGIQMEWKQVKAGSINVYSRLVTSDFKGKPTLAIEQSKGTASSSSSKNYTKSVFHFNQAVKDLTFSIYDLDAKTNQFIDVVEVIAYRKSDRNNPIYPKKHQTQTTCYQEYVPGGGGYQIKGKSIAAGGMNVADNSAAGDATITFTEAVDSVEVIYFNDLYTEPSTSSEQGITITDLSWRRAELLSTPTDINTASPQTGDQDGVDPLPVTLTSFDVKKVAEGAKLSWATASEVDNDRFVVERSTDGKTFQAIGEVKGSGNSNSQKAYSFTDRAPIAGNNYYRLTQYDFDGKSEVSKAIYLKNSEDSFTTLTTFPNPVPANKTLTIQASSAAQQDRMIYIMNASGRVIRTVTLPKNEVSVDIIVSGYPSGLYLIKAASSTGKFYVQ